MLGRAEGNIRPMQYPVLAGPTISTAEPGAPADPESRVRELQARLEEQAKQFARELELARREATDKGRQLAASERSAWRNESAAQLAAAIEGFRSRRDEYLGRVEQEVVRLALAIAERVIRREAQLDPLLLAGVVRVALGQLSESTVVRLRIPSAQKEMWVEMVGIMPGLPLRPEIVGDPDLEPTEAFLEAELGTVDLGVRAQLGEIERGFFDLLETRREVRYAEPPPAKQG